MALNYALEADQHGYIPMFLYYELFQSDGPCNRCNDDQKNITNVRWPIALCALPKRLKRYVDGVVRGLVLLQGVGML